MCVCAFFWGGDDPGLLRVICLFITFLRGLLGDLFF